MGHYLDIDAWSRKSQFDFFRRYSQPFFSICAEVDVTATVRYCRHHELSFFLASWFMCLEMLNSQEEFRYRLRGDQVWVHDRIHVSTTVLRDDETFGFCHLPSRDDFDAFEHFGKAAIDAERSSSGLTTESTRDDVIHGSVLPWLRFTSISHARHSVVSDSIPKIAFGRRTQLSDERFVMPMSVEAHHALLDGLHVSRLFERFEGLLAAPESSLRRQHS